MSTIIGGVVGGAVSLIILVILVMFVMLYCHMKRKKTQLRELFSIRI